MTKLLLNILLVTFLFSCAHHHGPASTQNVEAPKMKFVADAHLKKYMGNIKKSFNKMKRNKKPNVKAFRVMVQSSINGIVANCTLEEAADQYLHISLGKIFEGMDLLNDNKRDAGIKSIDSAFSIYEKGFL